MTDFSNPSTFARQSGIRRLIAWLIILGCAGFVAYRVFQSYRRPVAETADPSHRHSVQLQVIARYTIGARELLKSISEQDTKLLASMTTALNGVAPTSVDKLRLVIFIGEMSGRAEALRQLDELTPKLKDPVLLEDAQALRALYGSDSGSLTEAQREQLIAHHEWFGRLAAAYGKPADDPERRTVLAQAKRTAISLWCFFVILGLAALTGFILFIVAMIRVADGRVRLAYQSRVQFAYPPITANRLPFLEAFALWLGSYLLVSYVARKLTPDVLAHLWIYLLAMLLPPAIGIVWPLLCGVGVGEWRNGLGWHAGRGIFREIGSGLAGYVMGLPVMALGFIGAIALGRFSHANPTHPIIEEMGGSSRQLVSVFVLACIYAPIVEETVFRGAFFHYLRGGHRWIVAAVITSFIFAAIHPQGWTVVPVLFSIAFVFAGIREWRGTILASAAAHALNNGMMLTLLGLMLR